MPKTFIGKHSASSRRLEQLPASSRLEPRSVLLAQAPGVCVLKSPGHLCENGSKYYPLEKILVACSLQGPSGVLLGSVEVLQGPSGVLLELSAPGVARCPARTLRCS